MAFARSRDPPHAAFGSLGLGVLLFTGRNSFGWSTSFAPSDIVILFYRLAWSMGRGPGLFGSAFLGSLTAAFELLTGALPVAAALMLMACAFHGKERRERRALETLAVFGTAFLLMFAFKAVAVALAFDTAGATTAGGKLMAWTSNGLWQLDPVNAAKLSAYGVSPTLLRESRPAAFVFALAKMTYFSPALVFGSLTGGVVATVLLPAGLICFGAFRAFKGDRKYWLILTGVSVILGWFYVMLSHTIVHAYFMVRVMAWLGCMALAVLGWELAKKPRWKRLSAAQTPL